MLLDATMCMENKRLHGHKFVTLEGYIGWHVYLYSQSCAHQKQKLNHHAFAIVVAFKWYTIHQSN